MYIYCSYICIYVCINVSNTNSNSKENMKEMLFMKNYTDKVNKYNIQLLIEDHFKRKYERKINNKNLLKSSVNLIEYLKKNIINFPLMEFHYFINNKKYLNNFNNCYIKIRNKITSSLSITKNLSKLFLKNSTNNQNYIKYNNIILNDYICQKYEKTNKINYKIRKKFYNRVNSKNNKLYNKNNNNNNKINMNIKTMLSYLKNIFLCLILFILCFNNKKFITTAMEINDLKNVTSIKSQLSSALSSLSSSSLASESLSMLSVDIKNLTIQNEFDLKENNSTEIKDTIYNNDTNNYKNNNNNNNNNKIKNSKHNDTNNNNNNNIYYNNSLDLHSINKIRTESTTIKTSSTLSSSSTTSLSISETNENSSSVMPEQTEVLKTNYEQQKKQSQQFKTTSSISSTSTRTTNKTTLSSTQFNNNNNNNNNYNSNSNNNNYNNNSNNDRVNGCHSCQFLEQVKLDNIESIKKHILMRLELKEIPKIAPSFRSTVPPEIIESFYKGNRKLRDRYDTTSYVQQQQLQSQQQLLQQQRTNDDHQHSASSLSSGPSISSSSSLSSADQHNIRSTLASFSSSSIMMQDYNVPEYSEMDASDDFSDENGIYDDFEFDNEDYIADEPSLKDEFYSIVNSLYVFPTISRMRHNRKSEILNFSIQKNDHSTVSQAFLYIFIRGREWLQKNEPKFFENKFKNNNNNNNNNNDDDEIILTINKVIRRQNFTHTLQVAESHHKIPIGEGQWFHINVTEMVQNWISNPSSNHGIVIKTLDTSLRSLIVIDDGANEKRNGLYIEIQTKDNRKRRSKRNTSLNCLETDKEERCCRYPLEINFQKFGWDWIIAPTTFSAYFCSGQCKLGFIQKFPHTHLMQLSTAPQPCCSPSKMSPIRLLYFNHDNILVMSTIPNMSIDQCNCS